MSLALNSWSILMRPVLSNVVDLTLAMKLLVEPETDVFAVGQNCNRFREMGSVT